jgi:hypothetical protein
MVAVAHSVTVPDIVGEAVAVKLREVVMITLPVSDCTAWAKTGAAAGRFACSW